MPTSLLHSTPENRAGEPATAPQPRSGAGAGGAGLVSFKQVAQSGDSFTADLQVLRLGRLRRSVLTAARVTGEAHQQAQARYKVAMLTLTYRDGVEWQGTHLKVLTHRLRMWARRKGVAIPYVWVAELTKRGRVHYHFALWLPKGITIPKPDKAGWWVHGSTRVEWARHAVGYLAKYMSKAEKVHKFPAGLRLHGRGQIPEKALPELRWWMLPLYVRDNVTPEEGARRASGGYVSKVSGELFESGWGVAGIGGGFVRFVRKTALHRILHPLPCDCPSPP